VRVNLVGLVRRAFEPHQDQIKEHGVASFGKRRFAGIAQEDTPLSALCQIGGNGANVASVHQPIMGTIRVGARLSPVLGFSSKYYRVHPRLSSLRFPVKAERQHVMPINHGDQGTLERSTDT